MELLYCNTKTHLNLFHIFLSVDYILSCSNLCFRPGPPIRVSAFFGPLPLACSAIPLALPLFWPLFVVDDEKSFCLAGRQAGRQLKCWRRWRRMLGIFYAFSYDFTFWRRFVRGPPNRPPPNRHSLPIPPPSECELLCTFQMCNNNNEEQLKAMP